MTIADFHCEGTIPVFHIVLNKFKRVRVAVVPRCFKNSACTLSNPGDFLNFSWLIALFNSFTVNGSSKILSQDGIIVGLSHEHLFVFP